MPTSPTTEVLVVEGNTRETCQRMARTGETPYGESYADLLCRLDAKIQCTVVYPSEEGADCMSDRPLAQYSGIAWTGSSLNIYDNTEPIKNQLRFADRVLNEGLPIFGSCWGLQVFVTALGGKVRRNPKGREIGIARAITLTDEGTAHPMYNGKPQVFESLAVHLDEVEELPSKATVLATNEMSRVQAISINTNNIDFWGVQYHPEFDFARMAAILKRLYDQLLSENLYTDETELANAIQAYEGLGRRQALDRKTPVPGVAFEVGDIARRTRELTNWLRRIANTTH